MTFLEIVNKVLIKLRESEVSGTNNNDYSKLVAEFVNQAMYECERAWDWNALKETITITTAADDALYDFHTSEAKIISAINATNKNYIRAIPAEMQHRHDYLINLTNASPCFYSFESKNGDYSQVKLTPTPDGVYNCQFLVTKYTAELATGTDDSTELKLPALPIIMRAYALAVSERGEDGGTGYNEADDNANKVLADAIALDAANDHFSELTWYAI
jgi:hypothetical protein